MDGTRLIITSFWIRKQEMKTEVVRNQERKRSKIPQIRSRLKSDQL